MARSIEQMLSDDDCLTAEERRSICANLDCVYVWEWLDNLAQGDGTNNEAKLAAIMMGLIAARRSK